MGIPERYGVVMGSLLLFPRPKRSGFFSVNVDWHIWTDRYPWF